MKKTTNQKNIHFTGIAGSAMASVASAFKLAGFKVTGSEPKKVFPPMSDYLKRNKLNYYIGFDANKVGRPNYLVIGNAFDPINNPEANFARKNKKIQLVHLPKIVEKYLVKKNSIVVAGTYGKTTITAMTTWLMEKAGFNPNYMVAGIPTNLKQNARLTKTNWSIIEGDEYPSASPWDFSPKFKYFHPKYLILTSSEWDHMDIYKTKQSYIKVFKDLVKKVPKDGLIVAKLDGENLKEVLKKAKCKIVYYAYRTETKKQRNKKTDLNSFSVSNVKHTDNKTLFEINTTQFETSLIGDFNLENLAAAITLAFKLKIPTKIIQQAVKSFKGVKRRLEIRGVKKKITVIDDFAHSPSKAKQSILALKKHFPKSHIFIIFEPNRGGRSTKCLKSYDHTFRGIHKTFIPLLNIYAPKPGVKDVTGKELTEHLKKTHSHIYYQPNQAKIVDTIAIQAKPGDVVAFLGSRNFDTPIKALLKKLDQ